jgi:hypothetical protein
MMEVVENTLRKEFGNVEHVTKLDSNVNGFSFAVGFKYDRDALRFIKEKGTIYSVVNKIKLVGKPTAVFEECLPLIKEARKEQK